MTIDSIISQLAKSRGLDLSPVSPESLSSPFDPSSAISLIKKHLDANHKIAIYGDYDVDGISATAILWQTLYSYSKNIFPFIPHRIDHGYGLSILGIDECLKNGARLIITVDNGIVAHEQISYCKEKSCDVIIIDHHEPQDTFPDANVILHSTSCCATALAWFFSRDLFKHFNIPNIDHLDLVTIATVCDLVPLTGINRSLVKHGLAHLRSTTRPGLVALCKDINIDPQSLTPYHIGFLIGPRLNATGRLGHALDSLRLLCTNSSSQASQLAKSLSDTNRIRQQETEISVSHALTQNVTGDIIIVSDASYHSGVIGLISSKLTETHHRPSIAISIGESESKASARSISGFNITDHIRQFSHLLVNVGGHAMAAGFTIENSKLEEFTHLARIASIDPSLLIRTQRVDLEIPISLATLELYTRLQDLAPFGMGNPTPVFKSTNITITSPRRIGKDLQHLKFRVGNTEAIYFKAPPNIEHQTSDINLTYSLDLNTFNNQTNLQLIIKAFS